MKILLYTLAKVYFSKEITRNNKKKNSKIIYSLSHNLSFIKPTLQYSKILFHYFLNSPCFKQKKIKILDLKDLFQI